MTSRCARRLGALGTRKATLTILAATLTVLAACAQREPAPGGANVEEPADLNQTAGRVKDLIEETADAVLPGLPRTPQAGNEEPRRCLDEVGGFTERTYTQYGVAIELGSSRDVGAVLQDARTYWEQRGLEVDASHADDSPPALFLSFEGYSFELLVNAGRAFLGGSTPCVGDGA